MEESAGHLDDALNKWSRLERPDLARKYHGRALEMTQLRLSGARLSQEVVNRVVNTGEMDLDAVQQAADLFDKSDEIYSDVLAEVKR